MLAPNAGKLLRCLLKWLLVLILEAHQCQLVLSIVLTIIWLPMVVRQVVEDMNTNPIHVRIHYLHCCELWPMMQICWRLPKHAGNFF
jgi:hypothetical protein